MTRSVSEEGRRTLAMTTILTFHTSPGKSKCRFFYCETGPCFEHISDVSDDVNNPVRGSNIFYHNHLNIFIFGMQK